MTLRRNLLRGVLGVQLWVNLAFVVGATLLALAGHIVEIALWGFVLNICGAVPGFSAAIYRVTDSFGRRCHALRLVPTVSIPT
jgi:hypothetical protein